MVKKKHAAKVRREQDMLDRVLLWFGVSLIFELFLLAVNRYYFHYRVSEIELANTLDKMILPALTYIGLLGLVACIVWAVKTRKEKSIFLPVLLAALSAAVSASCYLARHYGSVSIQVLQVMVPVAAVLALIYYLYQREFFIITVLSGLSIFGLWLFRRAGSAHLAVSYGYIVVLTVVLVAAVVLAWMLQRGEGMLALGIKQYRVFPRNTAYAMIYITCALAVLSLAAAIFVGATAAYCAMLVMVAWIFVMAVYFTVRLM